MIDISVIVPVYNKAKYIEKCINSVIDSSFRNFELICVDDASTDDSLDIINMLAGKDSRITVIENNDNRGAGYSRNQGILCARGKYIMFLDADDYLDRQALDFYFSALEQHSAQGCFISLLIESTSTKKSIGGSYLGVYRGLDLMNHFVNNDELFLYACGALWKKSFLIDNKILFDKLKIGEGGLFILESLICAEKVVYCDFQGYHYFVNESSTNNCSYSMQESSIGQIKQIVFMIKELEKKREKKQIIKFLDWYMKKNIGGIKNLRLNKKRVKEIFENEEDILLYDLIKGRYLEREIKLIKKEEDILVRKGKVYFYGAGYETLDAIKYCHQIGVEIVKIFVTSKLKNPESIYGFHVFEFDSSLIFDNSIPFIVTAHEMHQKEICDMLKNSGIKNIFRI